jgi:hypothetical protein
MHITVKMDKAFKSYILQLEAMPDKVPPAMAAGLNDSGKVVTKHLKQVLKVQINPKTQASFTKFMFDKPASSGRLVYSINALSKPLPITDFNVEVDGGGVSADSWGHQNKFKRSFKTKNKGRLLARTGTARSPYRKLLGPNIGKELVKGKTIAAFHVGVSTVVKAAINIRLMTLLK